MRTPALCVAAFPPCPHMASPGVSSSPTEATGHPGDEEMGPSSGPQLASLTSEGCLQGRSHRELELQHLDLGGTEFSP